MPRPRLRRPRASKGHGLSHPSSSPPTTPSNDAFPCTTTTGNKTRTAALTAFSE